MVDDTPKRLGAGPAYSLPGTCRLEGAAVRPHPSAATSASRATRSTPTPTLRTMHTLSTTQGMEREVVSRWVTVLRSSSAEEATGDA